jgi:enterochelin esterase-like enzyme
VFEPTSWFFLGLLIITFGALLYWLGRTRNLALKVGAGVLAFAVSSLFGAALVNQYYAYYTTWGSIFDAATSSGVTSYQTAYGTKTDPGTKPPGAGFGHPHRDQPAPFTAPASPSLIPLPSSSVQASVTIPRLALAAHVTSGSGRVVRLALAGAKSGITRNGFVYLPPQYFQPAYASTSFPVVELLHGDPGDPSGWLYGLHVPALMDHLIDTGVIGPMVVVMPATFQGKHGQDCVDAPGGDLDDTYLSSDVPNDIVHDFRVLPQGLNWAIGGLSDGGFCAANLALKHPDTFGAVASLDGFYSASSDLAVMNKVFGVGAPGISANDPSTLVDDVRLSLPRFWIMSGTGNATDMKAARYFQQIVTAREPIEYVVVRNGKHTPSAWRVALPSLLEWTWRTVSGGAVGVGSAELNGPPAPPSSSAASPPSNSPSGPPAGRPSQPPAVSGSARPSATHSA